MTYNWETEMLREKKDCFRVFHFVFEANSHYFAFEHLISFEKLHCFHLLQRTINEGMNGFELSNN